MFEDDPLLHPNNDQERFYHTSLENSNWARAIITKYYRLVSNPTQLQYVEQKMLKKIVSEYTQEQVQIGPHTTINTLHFKCKSETATPAPPIVLLHGFGVGLGMFIKNFDTICQHADVYAIDLLGFGRSSRPNFSTRPNQIVQQYIQSLEDWRVAVGLNKFILLGHSFGGYLSTWYAMRYPDNIAKLILVEPWGYPPYSARQDVTEKRNSERPQWYPRRGTFKYKLYRFLFGMITRYLKYFLPFSFVRLGFGIGKPLFMRFRKDLIESYEDMIDADTLGDYFLHLNGQYPSGEEAFTRLHIPFGYCRQPLFPESIKRMDPIITMEFIYGDLSWMSPQPARDLNDYIDNEVSISMVAHSSHHVYANNTCEFNRVVIRSIKSINQT
ncbi:1-acylglycerol-3-phosphate O-acyltransferase ABHD5 [Oopsacas minuta]|uniref:1-acylglycerol-3-phosphate O-acyltransferase ABHD5 n=1 Tax=Oopsacas minuta TaxID=111878 RepID=A0AAV7JVA4_9METZ|nr:1-acylglycerol-3-phosphate O-acyltransferase ABHD5 [Oopsacas minuta]